MLRPLHRLLLAGVLLSAAACASGDGDGDGTATPATGEGRPQVVVTTSILGDVVRSVAGDAAEVEVLMPVGVDPHGYSPSARDASRLRAADLVVANGLGLEESLLDLLESAEEDGVVVLHVAEYLTPMATPDEHADDEHADEDGHADDEGHAGDDHGGLDPHVWLDPLRMANGAEQIAARLAEVEGPGGLSDQEWEDRGRAYADTLRILHSDIAELLHDIPDERRLLVTGHDNLRYFAARYGFDVVGTVIPGTSSQAQASTRQVADLAALVEELAVPAIFTDTAGGADRLAETLAAEIGRDVAVVALYTDALGEEGSGADTLVGLLRTNAERIAEALG